MRSEEPVEAKSVSARVRTDSSFDFLSRSRCAGLRALAGNSLASIASSKVEKLDGWLNNVVRVVARKAGDNLSQRVGRSSSLVEWSGPGPAKARAAAALTSAGCSGEARRLRT